MTALRTIASFGLGLGLAVLALGAAKADDTADRLKGCRGISDVSARAACYDRIVDGLEAQPRAAAPAVPAVAAQRQTPSPAPNAAAPTPTPTPVDRFGEKDLAFKQRVPEDQRPPDELAARVTGVRTDANGYGTFTLENGQIWRQMEASSLRISNGARVKLRSGTMGVFYLSLDSGNKSFRVKRLN